MFVISEHMRHSVTTGFSARWSFAFFNRDFGHDLDRLHTLEEAMFAGEDKGMGRGECVPIAVVCLAPVAANAFTCFTRLYTSTCQGLLPDQATLALMT